MVLLSICLDACSEQFIGRSLLETYHWIALRFMVLVLSISVFLQGRKLENLIDEKEELFLEQGYARGRLSSPFIQMRRKQLKLISHSYLAANMLVVVEIALFFGVKSPGLQDCANLCAQPYTNSAAVLLFAFTVIQLVPTHLFLYSFYIIPRKFHATHEEDMVLVNDLGILSQPLLEENLMLVEEDVNW